MNGPWTDKNAQNMQRVIRRLGFATSEDNVESAAKALYNTRTGKVKTRSSVRLCSGEKNLCSITCTPLSS